MGRTVVELVSFLLLGESVGVFEASVEAKNLIPHRVVDLAGGLIIGKIDLKTLCCHANYPSAGRSPDLAHELSLSSLTHRIDA